MRPEASWYKDWCCDQRGEQICQDEPEHAGPHHDGYAEWDDDQDGRCTCPRGSGPHSHLTYISDYEQIPA